MLSVQGKSKMNILCPTLCLFFCHHKFLQGEWTLNNESEVWAVSLSTSKWPGSVPTTETDFWPCYFGVAVYIPLCTVIRADMALEGLAMLLSWPGSQSELPSPLTGAHRQGSSCPRKTPRWFWRFITQCPSRGLQLLIRITALQEAHIAFTKVFHKQKCQGCFNPNQIVCHPPGLFLLPRSCSEACARAEYLQGAGTSEDREPHHCLCPTTGLLLLSPVLPVLSALAILVLCCLCAVKGEIAHYGNTRWDSVTLNHHREDFKGFLKSELSSAQPEVKYLNLYLGIKINRVWF